MSYYLFLDDSRYPETVTWVELPFTDETKWVMVGNYQEFVSTILEKGVPKFIAFDHDLADEHYKEFHNCGGIFRYESMTEKTGFCCAKWLCKYCRDNKIKFPEYVVHSLNTIGKDNIVNYIESYKHVVEGNK